MGTVSERIKDRFESARTHLEDFEKQVGMIEKKAKAQLEEVPAQLKGAWENVVSRLRTTLAFATRDELKSLSEKVDELAKKVEKLLRGDKIRGAAEKRGPKS